MGSLGIAPIIGTPRSGVILPVMASGIWKLPSPRRAAAWAVGLLALGIVVRLGGCADRLFFQPTRGRPDPLPGVEEVEFRTADGVRLHGWLFKPAVRPPAGWPVVLHCHGNAGTIADHAGFSDFLPEAGFAVLLFDYRGYGGSDPAPPSRGALVQDAHAALDYALSRPDLDHTRIGVLGVSLGGAFASRLAADRPEVRALALISAFTGWADVASDHAPLVGRLLVRRGVDPITAVPGLGHRPLLIIHGRRDRVVPFAHGERLAAAARAAGVLTSVTLLDWAGHNDSMEDTDGRSALAGFFRRELAP
jgi:hypothetical protein